MSGFVDLHAHVIYGMDDGAQTAEDMYAMLDASCEDGVEVLCCTPHVTPGLNEFDKKSYLRKIHEARAYCNAKRYPLEICTGAELLYTPALLNYIENNDLPSYGDSSVILMEFVPDITIREITEALEAVTRMDYIPIIAHVERYSCMALGGAYRLKDKFGTLYYQMNCNTILNSRSFMSDMRTDKWLRDRLIDAVSTDVHNTKSRPSRMSKAYKTLSEKYGSAYASELCRFSF